MVTVVALSAAVASFTGGRLADRFGFRRIIRIAIAVLCPLILLMMATKNIWFATTLVLLIYALSNMAQGPSVALGQKYLPNHLGLASGVTLGLAISVGGICSPLLGTIGDNYGLPTVFYVVSGVALIGFLGAQLLREPAAEPDEPATGTIK